MIIAGIVIIGLVAYVFLTQRPSRGSGSADSSFSLSGIFPQPDRYLSQLPRPIKTEESRTFLPVIPKRAARHIVAVHSNDPETAARLAEEKEQRREDERKRRRESMEVYRIDEERRRFEAQAAAKAVAKHHAALAGVVDNEQRDDDDDDEKDQAQTTIPIDSPRLDTTCFFVRGYKGWIEMPRLLKSIAAINEAAPVLNIDVELSSAGLWHATLATLLKELPSAAQTHREGPLIWGGCSGTPKHELLYLSTPANFINHLQEQGFIGPGLLM